MQEYVPGKDLSVSIIENSQGLNILSINAQFVEISNLNKFLYEKSKGDTNERRTNR